MIILNKWTIPIILPWYFLYRRFRWNTFILINFYFKIWEEHLIKFYILRCSIHLYALLLKLIFQNRIKPMIFHLSNSHFSSEWRLAYLLIFHKTPSIKSAFLKILGPPHRRCFYKSTNAQRAIYKTFKNFHQFSNQLILQFHYQHLHPAWWNNVAMTGRRGFQNSVFIRSKIIVTRKKCIYIERYWRVYNRFSSFFAQNPLFFKLVYIIIRISFLTPNRRAHTFKKKKKGYCFKDVLIYTNCLVDRAPH